ncbi:MAG: extracellular solute-binding protein [Opitutaceae bacterium]|nr:extracellular solute-binding protein [Opitutaceae bacterium]
MKKARLPKGFGLALLAAAYGVSLWWVFTRAPAPGGQRPVTSRIAQWQIESGPPAGIAAVIKRYEELNPQVKVEQLMIPGAVYKQWLRTNLAGGTATDILEWGAWLAGQKDLPARYFEPLTAELAQPNPYNAGTSQDGIAWERTFHDNLIGPRRDSPDPGQIYAVTITEVSMRLFCNVELYRKIVGGEPVFENYDQFRQALKLIRDYARRAQKPIHGLAGSRDNGLWLTQSVWGAPLLALNHSFDDAGYLYLYNRQVLAAYLEGRWNFEQPNVLAGLKLVRELSLSMKPGYLQLRRDDAMLEFFSGNAVFLFTGTWDATTIRRTAPFEIEIMRLPAVLRDDPEVGAYVRGPGGEGMGETAMAMYLNNASPHKKEAVDFLRFLTSVEGNQIFSEHSLWLPAVNGAKIPEPIRNFRSYRQGYALGQAPYDLIGSEVSMQWDQNYHLLSGENGSVEKFAEQLDRVMPTAIRTDLENEARNTLILVKPQDAQIVARARLAQDAPDGGRHRARQREMEMGQTMSEGLAFQMKLQLERTKPPAP